MKTKLRHIILLIIGILGYISVYAQQPAVSLIVHTKTGVPVETYVYFKLLHTDGTGRNNVQQVVKVHADGVCPVPFSGKVYAHIWALGYKSEDDTINTLNGVSKYDITIYPLTVQLNEYTVTTGQYQERSSDQSVYNTTVITSQQMQQRGDNNLAEALDNQLNIRMNIDPYLGTQTSMQGLSGDDVKILVDGVPVIGRNNGYIDISQLELNNIDHIEIIQGPMSVMYGTDAMGGVINLITKQHYDHPLEVSVHGYTSSIGDYNADGSVHIQAHNTTIALNGGRNFFSGYPHFNDSIRAQTWHPKLDLFGGATISHTFNKVTLRFRSQYFYEDIANLGTPVITPLAAKALDEYYITTRFDNSLSANIKLNNSASIDLLASYNYYQNREVTYTKDMVKLTDTLAASNQQDTSAFRAFVARAVYSYNNPTHKLNYQAGFDINDESAGGSEILHDVQRINDEALFASLEWSPASGTIIRPGLREGINSRYGHSVDFLDNAKFTPFLPSLNIKQNIAKNTFLRLSLARGYRAPELKELYLNFVDVSHNIHGNDSLKAETSNHADLQLSWHHQFGRIYFKAEPFIFYNDIHNGIVLAQINTSTNYYTYVNVYHYITKGITAPVYISYHSFNASVGYSLIGLYDTIKTAQGAHPFTYTNEWKASLDYTFNRLGLVAAVYYKHTGKTTAFATTSTGLITDYTDPYNIMDASLSKRFLHKRVTVTGGVKNIFNITDVFSSISTGPHSSGDSMTLSPGRSFFIDLRVNLYTNTKNDKQI